MNYLAHAYLSFGDPEILVGNMIGDYVKGKVGLASLPPKIAAGVMLHRSIDEFTDRHPATLRAKTYFRQDYRLYAGPFVDNIFDHFLANDPLCFDSDETLLGFTKATYQTLDAHEMWLPERFHKFLHHMKSENWLYDYRTLRGIKKSLERMTYRAKYLNSSEKAYEILVANYHILTQCFYELIPDLQKHVLSQIEIIIDKNKA